MTCQFLLDSDWSSAVCGVSRLLFLLISDMLIVLLSLPIEIANVFSRKLAIHQRTAYESASMKNVSEVIPLEYGRHLHQPFSAAVRAPRKSLLDVDWTIGSDK